MGTVIPFPIRAGSPVAMLPQQTEERLLPPPEPWTYKNAVHKPTGSRGRCIAFQGGQICLYWLSREGGALTEHRLWCWPQDLELAKEWTS